MAEKKFITDRYLRALPPAPKAERVEVWDSRVPGFGIRVSDIEDADPARRGKAGRVSFVLYARFGAGAAPTRRVVGTYGAITLEEARRIAGEWRSQIDKGVDPARVEVEAREKVAREAALRVQHSFANVAETFITDKLKQERRGKMAERDFRASFVAAWLDRHISDITALDVLEVINRKKRTAPGMARALLVIARRFFNWVIDQRVYGLTASPCDRLSVVKIIGRPAPRNRRLTDAELFAFWRATRQMKYPVGPVYRLLLLTGLRLNEAAHLSWPEIQGDFILIPASRMKGKEDRAREHLTPLSSSAQEVIASLPRFKNGPYLFSFKGGKQPLVMASTSKSDLDRRMLRTLQALARRRGEDHRHVAMPEWVNHDLRRTVRSGLSALRIPHNVAEAVLAHRPPGVVGTYDTHEYQDEKAEALEAWAQRLKSIVSPAPDNKVIALRGAAMIPIKFTYSDEQWSEISTVVRDVLGLDADQITTRDLDTGTLPLRRRIETAAHAHILNSAFESQTPGYKTRIKRLNDIRESTKTLRADIIDALAPSIIKSGTVVRRIPHDFDPLGVTERAIATLVRVIEGCIAAQAPPVPNTRKEGRDRLWSVALDIWIEIGGPKTGVTAADFLIAVSEPVFRKVRADEGRKSMASMPQHHNSVVEWLRVRAIRLS